MEKQVILWFLRVVGEAALGLDVRHWCMVSREAGVVVSSSHCGDGACMPGLLWKAGQKVETSLLGKWYLEVVGFSGGDSPWPQVHPWTCLTGGGEAPPLGQGGIVVGG